MSPNIFTVVLITGGLLATGGAIWASSTGVGAVQPVKQPLSVREGSARLQKGRTHTGYFVGRRRHIGGGGIRMGK